jgi:hypothetical protein
MLLICVLDFLFPINGAEGHKRRVFIVGLYNYEYSGFGGNRGIRGL